MNSRLRSSYSILDFASPEKARVSTMKHTVPPKLDNNVLSTKTTNTKTSSTSSVFKRTLRSNGGGSTPKITVKKERDSGKVQDNSDIYEMGSNGGVSTSKITVKKERDSGKVQDNSDIYEMGSKRRSGITRSGKKFKTDVGTISQDVKLEIVKQEVKDEIDNTALNETGVQSEGLTNALVKIASAIDRIADIMQNLIKNPNT